MQQTAQRAAADAERYASGSSGQRRRLGSAPRARPSPAIAALEPRKGRITRGERTRFGELLGEARSLLFASPSNMALQRTRRPRFRSGRSLR